MTSGSERTSGRTDGSMRFVVPVQVTLSMELRVEAATSGDAWRKAVAFMKEQQHKDTLRSLLDRSAGKTHVDRASIRRETA